MTLRAIETVYNGYRFRSRLEARWAIFFDVLQIPYRYELEGFTRNGIYYLPDFWLPNGLRLINEMEARRNVWAEVKPSADLTEEARTKIVQLVKNTGQTMLLLTGDPGPEAVLRLIYYDGDEQKWHSPFVSWIDLGQKGLSLMPLHLLELLDNPTTARNLMATPRLMAAYTAARQARFDGLATNPAVRPCESCAQLFVPRQPHHKLCQDCYSRQHLSSATKPTAVLSGSYQPAKSERREPGYACGCLVVIGLILLIAAGWIWIVFGSP